MILVDTSVLIDYFKGIDNDATDKLQFVLDSGIPFGINSFIYQELLQGARTEREFKELKTKIYFKCRKKGFQIGSTIDCLVAQTAVENNLLLLHNDEDFEMVSKVIKLKFF